MRIKEIDVVQLVNYLGFTLASGIILHFIIETIMLNNPFMKQNLAINLNSRKFYKSQDVNDDNNISMHENSSKMILFFKINFIFVS